jgi:hypothetical protein
VAVAVAVGVAISDPFVGAMNESDKSVGVGVGPTSDVDDAMSTDTEPVASDEVDEEFPRGS